MSPSLSPLQATASAVDPAVAASVTAAAGAVGGAGKSLAAGAARAQAQADAAASAAPSSFTDLLNRAALAATAASIGKGGAATVTTGASDGATKTGAATKADAASAAASTPGDAAASDNPLAGLAAILFSGPLQTPLTTPQATTQGQAILTQVQQAAPTAGADTLASWKGQLATLTQQLNQAEKGATGVDPTAPPTGWTEPANFAAARTLLTSLQGAVTQAQAAIGVEDPPTLNAATTAATLTAQGLQAAGLRFLPAQPQGTSTTRLLGASEDGSKGKAELAANPPPASAQGPAPAPVKPVAAIPTASTPASNSTAKAPEPDTAPVPAPSRAVEATGQAGAGPAATSASPAVAAKPGPSTGSAQARSEPTAPAVPAQADAPLAARSSAADAAGLQTAAPGQTTGQTAAQDPVQTAGQVAPAAVALLGAEIVKQAKGRATSFNIELHPADLGKVDVKLQIQADGSLAARMAFDNPVAAAQFQAQAEELRSSLQQAGFQVAGDALSFTSQGGQNLGGGSGGSGGSSGSGQNGARAFADTQAANLPADAPSDPFQARQAVGLDLRI